MSSSSLMFPKAANLFVISIWYCFLTSSLYLASWHHIFPHQTSVLMFTYCQHFHNICNHQTVISNRVGSPEKSYIEYTRMPSAIYQYVISPVISLPIRRGTGVLMNISEWEHHVLNTEFFMWNSSLFYHQYDYPDVDSHSRLSVSKYCLYSLLHWSLLTEFSYVTYENDKKTDLIPHKNCLLNHHFSPYLVHVHSEQLYYTSDLYELYMTSYR